MHQLLLKNVKEARDLKKNIYDQAVLEDVATSFPQAEDIIDNGTVNGMTANDIQKILNLKHSWEFILDGDVIQANSDYYLLHNVIYNSHTCFGIERLEQV